MSDVNFSVPLMNHLIELLRSGQVPKLQNLCFCRCNIGDDTLFPLLQFLIENPQALVRLDLSENNLTERSFIQFNHYLSQSQCSLQYLSMKNNKITSIRRLKKDEYSDNFLGSFFDVLKSNTSLVLLDLSFNQLNFVDIDSKHIEELSQNSSLMYLMLGNNRLVQNENSIESLILLFNQLPEKLEYLNLSYTGIDSSILQAIYEAVMNKTNLKHLSLSDNTLGRDSSDILSLLIRNNTSLLSLDLSDIHLGDLGARQLGESLSQNTTLRTIKLSRNRIGRSALNLVNQCLNKTNLQIDITNNTIPNDITERIQELCNNTTLQVHLGSL